MTRPLLFICLFFFKSITFAQVAAFPGAEGAGAQANGWRSGSVYIVTNLNSSGAGSFAQAISQPNRIIIFAVSGTINLEGKSLKIAQPNLLIAGQSAPGEGICFSNGGLRVLRSNVVLCHLRFRRGFIENGDKGDAVATDPDSLIQNIIFDHLSASWATDENLTLSKPNNTTAQYCIASEGLDYTNTQQTPPNHSEGSLWGTMQPNGHVSMHHMLYAHNRLRNPRTTAFENTNLSLAPVNDFRNNVVYNCSEYSSHTGSELVRMNWVNNYYKDGPSTPPAISEVIFTVMNDPNNKLYLSGNYVFGNVAKTANNWLAVNFEDGTSEAGTRTDTEFTSPSVSIQSAPDAYELVLENGGAILPSRDQIDLRIVNDVLNGTGKVINKETDLAADDRWQTYYDLPSPADSDIDGIPDFWEDQYGLNKNNASDNMADSDGDVYTNIEEYLNNTHPKGGTTPIVYVAAYDNRADEKNNETGSFRIFRKSGDLSSDLTINYTVGGTAGPGIDYISLSGSVHIPAGKSSAYVTITPVTDGTPEGEETVILHISPDNAYSIGLPAQSLVIIRDNGLLTSFDDKTAKELVSVYPNPAKDRLIAESTTLIEELHLLNSTGEKVYEYNGNLKNAIQMDIGNFPNGIYTAIIKTGNKILTRKIVLLR